MEKKRNKGRKIKKKTKKRKKKILFKAPISNTGKYKCIKWKWKWNFNVMVEKTHLKINYTFCVGDSMYTSRPSEDQRHLLDI
jgi:hypothetical protein